MLPKLPFPKTIFIHNNQGQRESAIKIEATKGGIDINADHGKDINISGGQVLISSKTNEENAINLTTDVGTSETIVVNNKQCINEAAIKI